MTPSALTPDLAARFAEIALGHVTREYPHKLDHVLDGPDDARTPRDLHPIFYGSFDWHSCVHGYWLLARLRRRFPGLPQAARIAALFDDAFTAAKVEAERAYLDRPSSRGFERPYGWAWLLKLSAELRLSDGPWADRLSPLADAFAQRFRAYLPVLTYPVRAGTHYNTAFALCLAWDHARIAGDGALAALIAERALQWFGGDAGAQAWEPGGDDFLSPTLIEAECMRRIQAAEGFQRWFGAFLPDIAESRPAALFAPAHVSDRSDGKIAHLDGVNLSRAWCWRSLASALAPGDSRRAIMEVAADRHLAAGLDHIAGDYMGEHWLATFATLALDPDA
ncbi:Protein of unknown function [Sphingomonas laterariae]|uniref:DUF2891 domain-containing protein n=1 Tax=Edaphosphingomonas laterariae TaxID=861865 RepID=A0A239G2U8_9SPHN|nr:DUF2891 domain-containing protein [Sphingomonas laterariae]SNS63481.1 Protein of unknown function [Sphingomonas laterariae]